MSDELSYIKNNFLKRREKNEIKNIYYLHKSVLRNQ